MTKFLLKFPVWSLVSAAICMVSPSVGEIQTDSFSSDSMPEFMDEKNSRYSLPKILKLAKELDFKQEGYNPKNDSPNVDKFLRMLTSNGVGIRYGNLPKQDKVQKRKFPEVDSRGFDSDIFDEGFGDWSPMKRW